MSLIKGWNKNTVNWHEVISIYNYAVDNEEDVKSSLPGFFVCHNAHLLEKVQNAMKTINAADAHAYFNISTKAKCLGLHHDYVDVYYWQCIGKVKIIVQGVEFYLEPGDMIKIPKFIKHDVIAITPRLGISMGVEYKE